MKVIEFEEKCKSCKGTGLYTGMGERDGAAVVCYVCKGTGCHHVKFEAGNRTKQQNVSMLQIPAYVLGLATDISWKILEECLCQNGRTGKALLAQKIVNILALHGGIKVQIMRKNPSGKNVDMALFLSALIFARKKIAGSAGIRNLVTSKRRRRYED